MLSVLYGDGGSALPAEGGVLLLHLDVQLAPQAAVSVMLRVPHGDESQTACAVIHVAGNTVSCTAPPGTGPRDVLVTVDSHSAIGEARAKYGSRRAACVGM